MVRTDGAPLRNGHAPAVWAALLLTAALAVGACKPLSGSAGERVGGRLYVQPTEPSKVSQAQVAEALTVVSARAAVLTGQPQQVRSEDKVLVVDNLSPEMAQKLQGPCGRRGMIGFALIPKHYQPASPDADPAAGWLDTETDVFVDARLVQQESELLFSGRDLAPRARVTGNQRGKFDVSFELRPERREAVREVSAANLGRRMIITCDNEVLVAPVVRSPIPGRGVISDVPSQDEADALRAFLESGPLPYAVRTSTETTLDTGPGATSGRGTE